MKIRTRLTLQFLGFTALILLASSIAIYVISSNYRREDFYNRLLNKSINTAKLRLEVDEIDNNLLMRLEKDNPLSLPNEKIIILDYKNNILFSTDENSVIKYDENLLNQIRLDREVRLKQGEYEVLGYLFTSKYDRFAVIAAANDIYGLSNNRNLLKVLLFVDLLCLLLLLFAGWIFSGKALKPISGIIEEVDRISESNLYLRLNEGNRKDELEQLAHTFNKMLVKLEGAFKNQKNFIAHASHELRTPLMAITGQIEYILLNRRSQEEYENILTSIFEDIKSLNKLTNRLLMLTQTNIETQQSAFVMLRIDEIIWEAYEDLKRLNPGYIVSIQMNESLNDENMTVKGDDQLLKTAFLNLMENGCKYSDDHTVSINMSYIKPDFISIEFNDQGIGIPAGELDQILKPFFRGSGIQQIKGHGIGLPLTAYIINIHNGKLEVTSKPEIGTHIVVTIPIPANK